jgi:hypothetical protein
MALKSRSSEEIRQRLIGQLEYALEAAHKERPGQYLRASDLKRLTGVAKNRIRELLKDRQAVKIVKISRGPTYQYFWVGKP